MLLEWDKDTYMRPCLPTVPLHRDLTFVLSPVLSDKFNIFFANSLQPHSISNIYT